MKSFFLAFLLFLFSTVSSYAQTFFGSSSAPITDPGLQPGPIAVVIPPASMQAGDLVIMYGQYAANGAALAIGVTGGQTWNSGAVFTPGGTTQSIFISWCRFNGTWAANPTVTGPGLLGLTAVMYVFRPTTGNSLWGVNIAQTNTNGNGLPQTIASVTTTLPNTVTMGFFSNLSVNTWGVPSAGWTKSGGAQYRNNTTGQTHTAVHKIQTAAGATGAVTVTQAPLNVNTLKSIMSWYELNDNCSGAISLTPSAGSSCSATTPGTMVGATISSGVPAGCATGSLYDVWYSFTATSSDHTVTLSSYGANFTRRQIEIYQGTCGALSLVTCSALQTSGASLALNFIDFSPGSTYYIRVIYPNTVATPISTNGTFNICVTTNTVSLTAKIQTGKSYTNITRPSGGVVQNGDILEFRNVIAVGDWVASGNIYNTTFHDTLPAGLSYVANSIRFKTNEGLPFESGITGSVSLTDASGDDEAVYSGGVIRVNVGSLARDGGDPITSRQLVYQGSAAVTPITYASAGGGKISPLGRPSQFKSFSLIVVTYQATVTAATGSTFATSNGAFRYKTTTSSTNDVGFPQTVVSFPQYSVYVSAENTLCQTSVGINAYSNGDFGSGNKRHDSTQLLLAPGYVWSPFATGNPGDGLFSVVNNTSADLSTNKYVAIPDAVRRVFKVWDIIGDHTNALNVDSGNFAVPYGTNGGYMAVVNAAYGINTAVQRNITGLCGDTYYEFSAWFKNICAACSSDSTGRTYADGAAFKSYIPSKTLSDSAGVSPDVTYTIDGVDYYTSGSVIYDRRWRKKGFLFKTGPAQTSVILTIRNNAPGGGGNDWAVDDIGLATCLPSLAMRPSNTPAYCLNGQINMSVIVNTYYNNYQYYQWERSTDGGTTWAAAPELPGVQTYTYTYNGTSYLDTVAYPTIIATALKNGYKYRIKTATSLSNLSSSSCSVYNTVDVITITVNSGCAVLPVELLQFNAQLKNGYTELKWQSKMEQDLQQYEVEKSTDGKTFVKIGTVSARGGVDSQNYTFIDPTAVSEKVYYRLKLVATGSSASKYSNVLSVTGDLNNSFELTNLVNPFTSKISFQVTVPQSEVIEINLLDAAGKIIYQTKMNVNKGINAMNFEAPSNIQKGNYLFRILSKEGVVNKVIQKH